MSRYVGLIVTDSVEEFEKACRDFSARADAVSEFKWAKLFDRNGGYEVKAVEPKKPSPGMNLKWNT